MARTTGPALAAALLMLALAGPTTCGDDDSDSDPASGTTDTTVAGETGTEGAGATEATVVTGAGDIDPGVEEYRALLGPDNGGAPGGAQLGRRREINWDAVPDEFAAPNALPADFFNAAEAPRARGAVARARPAITSR